MLSLFFVLHKIKYAFQGVFVKSWKTRYFVLRSGDLSYFKVPNFNCHLNFVIHICRFIFSLIILTPYYQNKDHALHGEVPLNTFFLKDATIEVVPFSKHDKSCVFEIQFSTSSGNKNRTLVLESQSEADRTEWVDALISHLDTDSDHSRFISFQPIISLEFI